MHVHTFVLHLPLPFHDFGHVLAVALDELGVLAKESFAPLDDRFCFSRDGFVLFAYAFQGVDDQVEAVGFVADHHVERGGGGSFFLVSVDREAMVAFVWEEEVADRADVSVEVVDDRFGFGEVFFEAAAREQALLFVTKSKCGQFGNIHKSTLERRKFLFEDLYGCQTFGDHHVSRGGEYNVWIFGG